MDRATYAAASGGLFQLRKLEIVNNNLANINTPGYKRQILLGDQEKFEDTLASQLNIKDPFARADQARTPGTVNLRSVTDFSAGPVNPTGNPLDVALRNPNDFFVVETAEGQYYSRAGNFTLSGEGELITKDGARVVGDGGSIVVTGAGASIGSNGGVLVNGREIGRLQVARFENPSTLERIGASRFKIPSGSTPPQTVDAEVIPQSLEMSNVSGITSVVDLIVTQRGFQMYSKAAETIDSMNQTAISQIGRRT